MKISLTSLSTKDLATLAQRVLTTSNSKKYPVVNGHPLATVLQTIYTGYDAVYTKHSYSGKGKDVALADDERDRAYGNLKAFLNGYRKISSMTNQQSAADLYKVFKNFGLGMDRLSYSSQTAQMKKLIETLELAENLQKLNALGLDAAFADMKARNEAFEQLFAEQAEANAELREMESASSMRKGLERALLAYLNLITAMKDVDGWKLLYADVDELVKAARNSLK